MHRLKHDILLLISALISMIVLPAFCGSCDSPQTVSPSAQTLSQPTKDTMHDLLVAKWHAVEHEEDYGSDIESLIDFFNDSTGQFVLLSIDSDTSVYETKHFCYTFNSEKQEGIIRIEGRESVYPFYLKDTTLFFPSSKWEPLPYVRQN